MNTLAVSANKVLEAAIAAATKTGEFMAEQIPDVLHQLLLWNMIQSILQCVLGLFLMLVVPYIFYRFSGVGEKLDETPDSPHYGKHKTTLTHNYDGEFGAHGAASACVVVGVFGMGCFLMNLAWLKIWLAPKVWLLEYAASLIK